MSEIVDRRMEAMAEEFEEIRRLNIMENYRIRRLIKNRKDFEYKINGLVKQLRDYVNYIKHEEKLLEFFMGRKKHLKATETFASLEYKILKRIKNLYETGIQRFPQDLTFCLSYLRFSKQYNCNSTQSAIHFLTNNHPKKELAWLVAARYFLKYKKNLNLALTMLHKGIALNMNSPGLYGEIIYLEINEVENLQNPKPEKSEQLDNKKKACLEKLKTYMNTIYKYINDCDFYTELLSYLHPHTFTFELQKDIVKVITKKFEKSTELWHYLAIREHEGVHYDDDNDTSQHFKSALCYKKYKEGLSKVEGSSKQHLWKCCIDTLIKITLDDCRSHNVSTAKLLLEAYQQAHEEGYLSEEHYVTWIDNVKENDEKYAVAEKGLSKYPCSVQLWRQKFYIKQDLIIDTPEAEAELNEIFKQGVEALKDKSLLLWNAMIRYYQLNLNDSKVEQLYKDGMQVPGVANDLKSRYISYLNLTKGIAAARKMYQSVANTKPYSKELHEAMWRAESTEIKFNHEEWEKVHKLAIEQFPEDEDVWIDYLRYLMLYSKNLDLKRINDIRQRALSSLPEHRRLVFQDKFSQLQNLCSHEDMSM